MESMNEWQLPLSIQSCFPEAKSSGPSSSLSRSAPSSISQGNINNNITGQTTRSFCILESPVDEILEDTPPENFASVVVPILPPVLIYPPPPVVSSPLTHRANSNAINNADVFIEEVQNVHVSRSAPVSAPTFTSRHQRVGSRSSVNRSLYIPLYKAALKGDWEKAKEFIDSHSYALSARISKGWETVLHIAAGAKQAKFVEELIELMDTTDLELKNKHGNTALCFAAASGNKRIAEAMVNKNKNLPAVRGIKGMTPLHMAALFGHRDMVWFLYSVTSDKYLTEKDYVGLLIATISSDIYDVALFLIDRHPKLAIERDSNGETALHVLARKTSAFSDKSGVATVFFSRLLCHAKEVLGIQDVQHKKNVDMQALELLRHVWEQILLLDDAHIEYLLKNPWQPIFVATEFGNFKFVSELIRTCPDLMWKVDDQSRSVFHIAVMHRQEKIFSLIYDIGAHKDLITAYKDANNTNILHLAGMLAPSNRLNIVSGAALQMQRELLWFKEVEKNVQTSCKEMRDIQGRTPRMLFTEEHKELVKHGERWMKDTASSCMLVATLITTVMFAAIFTIPGGNNNGGTPNFVQTKSFIIFTISDAFALFSSVTSILMFLSILTSRYAEEDFLETLPKRLIIGLATLFFSIASMLIAFSAAFVIVICHQLAWVVVPVALTACIPVTLFAFLQFPLLADTIHSTCGSGIFARQNEDVLY